MTTPTYVELLSSWLLAAQLLEKSLSDNAELLDQVRIGVRHNEKTLTLLDRQADEIARLRNELNQQRWITGDTWESALVQ